MGRRSGDRHAWKKCNAKKILCGYVKLVHPKIVYSPENLRLKNTSSKPSFLAPILIFRGVNYKIINIQSPNWKYHCYSIPPTPRKKIEIHIVHIMSGSPASLALHEFLHQLLGPPTNSARGHRGRSWHRWSTQESLAPWGRIKTDWTNRWMWFDLIVKGIRWKDVPGKKISPMSKAAHHVLFTCESLRIKFKLFKPRVWHNLFQYS